MAMCDTGRCDWCERKLPKHSRIDVKYCKDRNCRQLAYQNRVRTNAKLKREKLPPDAVEDVKRLKTVSRECADMIMHVARIAGAPLAEQVLAGVWDVLVQTGCLDKVVDFERG